MRFRDREREREGGGRIMTSESQIQLNDNVAIGCRPSHNYHMIRSECINQIQCESNLIQNTHTHTDTHALAWPSTRANFNGIQGTDDKHLHQSRRHVNSIFKFLLLFLRIFLSLLSWNERLNWVTWRNGADLAFTFRHWFDRTTRKVEQSILESFTYLALNVYLSWTAQYRIPFGRAAIRHILALGMYVKWRQLVVAAAPINRFQLYG